MKLHITDDALRTLRPDDGKAQVIMFDDHLSGLGVVVGKISTTFIVHKRVGKEVHREMLGRWRGRGGDMSVTEARKAARVIIGKLEGKEATPGAVKRASKLGPTLAEACGLYVAKLVKEGARPSSVATVEREITGRGAEHEGSYLRSWLSAPLASITGKECRARHEKITTANGPHVANRVMRELRAIWNHVSKEVVGGMIDGVETFPANPTLAVVWNNEKGTANYVERRGEPIAWADFPAWHKAVMAIENGVRRDYNLIATWTGIRRSDLGSLRWEHINTTSEPLPSRVWHVGKQRWEKRELPAMSMLRPSPKGGADRSFLVPISTEIARILDGRRIANAMLGHDEDRKSVV